MKIVVATHNLMHARRLPDADRALRGAAQRHQGLDLLCLQENRFLTEQTTTCPADRIATALGPDFRVVRDDGCRGGSPSSTIRARWPATPPAIVPLPRLAKLTPFERLLLRRRQDQAEVRPARGAASRAGGHARFAAGLFPPRHRGREQPPRDPGGGDRGRPPGPATSRAPSSPAATATPSHWRRQPEALQRAVRAAGGVRRPPTPRPGRHSWFARQNEGKLDCARRALLLGKLGPRHSRLRYDVVVANLPGR